MKQGFFRKHIDVVVWMIAIVWTVIAAVVAWYNLTHRDVNLHTWLAFYKYFIFFFYFWSIPITALFIGGGIRDLCRLFKALKEGQSDASDDGQLRH
jgi:hypothetical protein